MKAFWINRQNRKTGTKSLKINTILKVR